MLNVLMLFFIFNKIYKFDLLDFFNSPYIIGTMNQATSSTPNLQLHHNFRYCLFMFLIYVCGLKRATESSEVGLISWNGKLG